MKSVMNIVFFLSQLSKPVSIIYPVTIQYHIKKVIKLGKIINLLKIQELYIKYLREYNGKN